MKDENLKKELLNIKKENNAAILISIISIIILLIFFIYSLYQLNQYSKSPPPKIFITMDRVNWPIKHIKCKYCGEDVACTSNNQKYCSSKDNPECYDQRVTSKMSDRQYARYRGITYQTFLNNKT